MRGFLCPTLTAALLLALAGAGSAAESAGVHGLALHGDLKYGPGFAHLEYVNPDAPKGGEVRLAQLGTFDSLNGYILKGVGAAGLDMLYDTLTYQAEDEPFSAYGLVAESIEVPADHSWVAFTLRSEARFHDGTPITPDDVVFTFEALKTKGHPSYRAYYANVIAAEKVGERKVRFEFSGAENRELPLIVGQMPVLPKAYWSKREFDKTTLEPPLGSGPYQIASVDPGRSITYRRVEDYWGADLPVNRGRHNFGTIRFEYYRDSTVALEAFKAGEYDFRLENVAKNWATAYDSPALAAGRIKKLELPDERPQGMQAFVFNTRRPMFADAQVRRALAYAFDFEWTNKNLFFGAYTRTNSYFANSELAAAGLPGPEERAILEPFRERIPEEVLTATYEAPSTDGSGNIRDNLRQALRLLKAGGWQVKAGKLVNAASGEPLRFELMLLAGATFERIALPFARNLERLGIEMSVRPVDAAQYQKRLDDFDFDLVVFRRGQSLSPGNEQRDYWGSAQATVPGSQNLAGIRDPVVDELVALLIAAPDRASLVYRTRALDRVLLWGHYVIPHWHLRLFRIAHWEKLARPTVKPKYGLAFESWWVNPNPNP